MKQDPIFYALKARFPHFTDDQCNSAAHWIHRAFYLELDESPSMGTSIVENIYQYFTEEARKHGKNLEDLSFGYAIQGAKRWTKVANIFKGYDPYSFEERFERLDRFQYIQLIIEDHCFGHTAEAEKRLEFICLVEKAVGFTKTEASVWGIMKDVSEDLVKGEIFDFWSEVWFRVDRKRVDISKRYFDALKSRILEKIRTQAPQAIDALHYSHQKPELENLITALEQLEFLFNQETIDRMEKTAYQFTPHELKSMIKLSEVMRNKIGGHKNFGYHIDRFPKVYCAKLPVGLDETLLGQDENENINLEVQVKYTDALGRYVYSIDQTITEFETPFTKEGVILIDTEKICRWAGFKQLVSEDVRFVVLMHELGHWFSHWALCIPNDENKVNTDNKVLRQWNPGFELPNTVTKEAIANIFCYWACNDVEDESLRERLLNTLGALTPKGKDTNVDTSNPYGAHTLLKHINRHELLNKLNVVRANWMLKDEHLFDYLKSTETNIFKWLGERKPEEVSIDGRFHTLVDKSVWDTNSSRILSRQGTFAKRP